MTGVSTPWWRKRRNTSNPSIPGISRSSNTQSTALVRRRSSASAPLVATLTWCRPMRARSYAYCSASGATSSTISRLLTEAGSRDRNVDRKGTARAGRSVHAHRPAQVHQQTPHDGKPETRASRLGGVEVVERAIQLLLAHATARIRHREADAPIRSLLHQLDAQRDLPVSLFERVHRVRDQILENPSEHDGVGFHRRQRVRHPHV